ncbi:MAG: hypothetical protein NXH75_13895 [Halobacteriovoraceae bacterium]|nr:hypothetical protein [Halobacteriovoraceae bacterium]
MTTIYGNFLGTHFLPFSYLPNENEGIDEAESKEEPLEDADSFAIQR